jgi:hypothetical protein
MRMRLKSKWRDKGRDRSLEDNAVALASNLWRIALTCAKNLHEQQFIYESDEQRMAVIREYLAFLVHLADRLTAQDLMQEDRERFIVALARAAARHVQENQAELLGGDDHASAFIVMLNQRSAEYSEMPFDDNSQSYAALRHLARKVQAIMGSDQTNRWITEQVIEIDAPEAAASLKQALEGLFGSTGGGVPAGFDPEAA